MHSNEMKFVPFFVAVLFIFSESTVNGVGFDNGNLPALTEESNNVKSNALKPNDSETWTKERLELLKSVMLRECINFKAANIFECWYLKYLKERDKNKTQELETQKGATTDSSENGSFSAQFETQRLSRGSNKNFLSAGKEGNESIADKLNSSQQNPASKLHQQRNPALSPASSLHLQRNSASSLHLQRNHVSSPASSLYQQRDSASSLYQQRDSASSLYQQRDSASSLHQQQNPASSLHQQRNPVSSLHQQRNPASSLHQQRSDNAELYKIFMPELEGNLTSFPEELDNLNISSTDNSLTTNNKDAITMADQTLAKIADQTLTKIADQYLTEIADQTLAENTRLEEDKTMMTDLDVEEQKTAHNWNGLIVGSLAGFLVAVIIIAVVLCNAFDKNKYFVPPQEDKLLLFT